MVEISLYTFLIIYGLGIALFIIFAIFNLYHLFAYGFLSFSSFLVTFLFLAFTILLLFITYKYGQLIDWSTNFVI